MEYLASDAKMIKDSLSRMRKYILEKSIDNNKANDVQDLVSIGKAAWKFLSAFYKSYWDNLFVNDSNTFFRNKIKSKFSPQVNQPQTNGKGKKIVKPTFVSTLPPPILAKLPKEVNEISKYFKKNEKQLLKKIYTQASSMSKLTSNLNLTSNIVLKTLKIKEMSLHLQNKKINQVQKIISGNNNKLKPQINMTIKRPSRKQIIISMNSDVAK